LKSGMQSATASCCGKAHVSSGAKPVLSSTSLATAWQSVESE
jgi:hypothetical protein